MPLQFTEIITLELSKRDANLAFADREFEWALETLKSFQNPFATRLYQSLLNRILQRREQDIATLLAYLEKAGFLDMLGNDPKPKHLSYSSRKEMAKAAVALYVRLFSNEDIDTHEVIDVEESPEDAADQDIDDPGPEEDGPPPAKKCLYEDHKNYQQRHEKPPRKNTPHSLSEKEVLKIIKKEMVLYEETGNRGKLLQKIYHVLKSIPPTSTEAEGGFKPK